MHLPVFFITEIEDRIDYIKFRNQFNIDGLSQWQNYLDWIARFISNKSIAWDYAGQFKSDRYGNVYFNSLGYNLVFNFEKDEETTQLYVVIVDIDLNIDEFGLNESKTRKNTNRLTETYLYHIIKTTIRSVLREHIMKGK